MPDSDPRAAFPSELSLLGERFEHTIMRLEKSIDKLVNVLEVQPPGPTKSIWAKGVNRAADDNHSEVSSHIEKVHSAEQVGVLQKSKTKASLHSQKSLRTNDGDHQVGDHADETEIMNDIETLLAEVRADGPNDAVEPKASTQTRKWRFPSLKSKKQGRSAFTVSDLYHHHTTKHSRHSKGWLSTFVMSAYFDAGISFVVLCNAMMLGIQVNEEATHNSKSDFFKYFEWACTAIFTVELTLRVWALGWKRLCHGMERLMTTMDVMLVCTSILDMTLNILMTGAGVSSGAFMVRLIKILRIGRLLRPLRTVALLGELRVIAAMIVSSFRSLFWLMCILATLTYCFSLVLTQGAALYFEEILESGNYPAEYPEVKHSFGSVLRSMYSLFLGMTGGRNWGELASLISTTGYLYGGVLLLFIFINVFSVLNIVTGVFVDGAIEMAKRDRNMMIEKQNINRVASRRHLVALLAQVDTDGDGVISKDEFHNALEEGEVQDFMDALGIDPENAAEVFMLLDSDGDGVVQLVEFIQGMERIRGEAKSVDIHMLLLHTKKIIDMLNGMQGVQSKMWEKIHVPRAKQPKQQGGRWDDKKSAHPLRAPTSLFGR